MVLEDICWHECEFFYENYTMRNKVKSDRDLRIY